MDKMDAAIDGSMKSSLQNALEDIQEMYTPAEGEPYISEHSSPIQKKIVRWRDQLLEESRSTLNMTKEEPVKEVDLLDEGAFESYMNVKLRTSTVIRN